MFGGIKLSTLRVFLCHTLITSPFNRKRYIEMFIHHVVIILLMTLSWMSNMVRIGTLGLVVHDSADIFIEAPKRIGK